MSRKNGNVRRSNDRGRLARQKSEVMSLGVKKQPRLTLRLDELIMPDGQCSFRAAKPKSRFATKEKAQKALAQIQEQRSRSGSRHVEKRSYRCPEGGCGGWHLTSRETFEEKTR